MRGWWENDRSGEAMDIPPDRRAEGGDIVAKVIFKWVLIVGWLVLALTAIYKGEKMLFITCMLLVGHNASDLIDGRWM